MKKTIEEIAREDGRYDAGAIRFVYEGLGVTIQKIREEQGPESEPKHITGEQLCLGLAQLAVGKWGRLAKMVFDQWRVRTTRDLGEIVYLMIGHKWMSAQEADSIEDFNDLFDFEQMFEKDFKFNSK